MTKIKETDFVELDYTGRTKEDNLVFDTTDELLSKSAGIHQENKKYGPVIVCVGQRQLIPGLDDALQGKDLGVFTLELPPEEAFGKKDVKLIQIIPRSKFQKEKINPFPGMQINVDGQMGIVKTAGGRVLVDFNHPLAGKEVSYEVDVKRIVTDTKEKVESYVTIILGIDKPEVEIKEKTATIKVPFELPKEIQEELHKRIKELVGVEAKFEK